MISKRKAAFIAVAAVSAGVGFLLTTPFAVKWHVEKSYPGVTVDDVSLRPGYVKLKAQVNRPGLQATLPDVRVDWGGQARIQGGTVNVILGETKAERAQEHRKATAYGLTVNVSKGDLKANLHNVSVDEQGTITAETGEASSSVVTATFKNARYSPKERATFVQEASGKYLKAVHTYPTVAWSVKNASLVLNDDAGTAESAKVQPEGGPEVALEGLLVAKDLSKVNAKSVIALGQRLEKVNVTLGEPINVVVGAAVVQHEWLNSVPVVFDKPVVFDIVNKKVVRAGLQGLVDLSWIPDAKTIDGKGACAAWVSNFPVGLTEPLDGIKFTGDVSFRVIYGDKPSIVINSTCRATCDAEKLKALSKPFTYKVYTATNDFKDRTSGPGSSEWVGLGGLPPGLMDAAIALEDPGFASHRGFITQAYRNSLEDNIKLGRFHRGGSTITMQLAKNLWLRRDKTLGRKAQEFFLAQAIESCYTKDKIIELYLNVVEYGPDLYGIGGAARHYFKVTPSQLKPVEAFWLMSILPHPRKAGTPDAATLDRTRKFMDTLMKNGRIPDTYLDDVGQPDDSEWGHQL